MIKFILKNKIKFMLYSSIYLINSFLYLFLVNYSTDSLSINILIIVNTLLYFIIDANLTKDFYNFTTNKNISIFNINIINFLMAKSLVLLFLIGSINIFILITPIIIFFTFYVQQIIIAKEISFFKAIIESFKTALDNWKKTFIFTTIMCFYGIIKLIEYKSNYFNIFESLVLKPILLLYVTRCYILLENPKDLTIDKEIINDRIEEQEKTKEITPKQFYEKENNNENTIDKRPIKNKFKLLKEKSETRKEPNFIYNHEDDVIMESNYDSKHTIVNNENIVKENEKEFYESENDEISDVIKDLDMINSGNYKINANIKNKGKIKLVD